MYRAVLLLVLLLLPLSSSTPAGCWFWSGNNVTFTGPHATEITWELNNLTFCFINASFHNLTLNSYAISRYQSGPINPATLVGRQTYAAPQDITLSYEGNGASCLQAKSFCCPLCPWMESRWSGEYRFSVDSIGAPTTFVIAPPTVPVGQQSQSNQLFGFNWGALPYVFPFTCISEECGNFTNVLPYEPVLDVTGTFPIVVTGGSVDKNVAVSGITKQCQYGSVTFLDGVAQSCLNGTQPAESVNATFPLVASLVGGELDIRLSGATKECQYGTFTVTDGSVQSCTNGSAPVTQITNTDDNIIVTPGPTTTVNLNDHFINIGGGCFYSGDNSFCIRNESHSGLNARIKSTGSFGDEFEARFDSYTGGWGVYLWPGPTSDHGYGTIYGTNGLFFNHINRNASSSDSTSTSDTAEIMTLLFCTQNENSMCVGTACTCSANNTWSAGTSTYPMAQNWWLPSADVNSTCVIVTVNGVQRCLSDFSGQTPLEEIVSGDSLPTISVSAKNSSGIQSVELNPLYFNSRNMLGGSFSIGPFCGSGGDYAFSQGYYAGENNTGNYVLNQGYYAGQWNTNNNVLNQGGQAGQYNTGGDVLNQGQSAGANNTANFVLNQGQFAGQFNGGGGNVVNQGYYAGWKNTGSHVLNQGQQAGEYNTGSSVLNQGEFAGQYNTGNYCFFQGYQAGQYNNEPNNMCQGYQSCQNNTGQFVGCQGYQACQTNSHNYCHAWGRSATCSAANQFTVGSSSYPEDMNWYATSTNLTPYNWAVTLNGGSYNIMLNSGTASFAVGSAAGSGASASCTTNHVCTARSGTVSITTAGTPTTGTLLTITTGVTVGSAALPNCLFGLYISGFTLAYPLAASAYSTTTITVAIGVALVTGDTYTLTYRC